MSKSLKIYKASAGSGKTFRLAVEYIKLLIANPLCYSNILAVTFTNKATAEMKLRILSQLYGIANGLSNSEDYFHAIADDAQIKALKLSDAEIRQRASEALAAMMNDYSRFRIETIDAFFQSIIRQLAHELHLSNNIRLEIKNDKVLADAVKSLLDDLVTDKALLQSVLGIVEDKINDSKNWMIEQELEDFGKNLFNETYLELCNSESLHGEQTQTENSADSSLSKFQTKEIERFKRSIYGLKNDVMQQLKSDGTKFLKHCEDNGLEAAHFRGGGGNTGIWGFMEKTSKGERNSKGELPNLSKSVRSFLEAPSAWLSKQSPKNTESVVKEHLLPVLKDIFQLRKLLNTVDATLTHINQLLLIFALDAKVRAINSEENRFLLADTAYLLNSIIQGQDVPFIYEKAGVRFKHIMIDEFQDTSSLQWKNFIPLLLNSMATASQCLIVGDVKQSIYRWRNSDWSILKDIEQNPVFGSMADVQPMKKNFRSSGNVIIFNNSFFTAAANSLQDTYKNTTNLTTDIIADAYKDVEQEILPKKDGKGYVRVEFVEKNKDEDVDVATVKLNRIVDNVRMLIDQGVNQNDICILVRYNRVIADIQTAFAQQMPQVNIVSDEAFRLDSSQLINFIIDILRYISNPAERYLKVLVAYKYAVLINGCDGDAGSVFMMDDRQLDQLLPKSFTDNIERLTITPLYELVEHLYDMFGMNRMENQDAYIFTFLDQLLSFVSEQTSNIDTFLKYWEEVLCSVTIPVGEIEGIRIMSIHKSKGLEFHSVIVPYCEWQFVGTHKPLIWCKPSVEPFSDMPILPITAHGYCKDSYYSKEYAEEKLKLYVDNLNLIYVAFTRAKNNLIIISSEASKSDIDGENVSALLKSNIPALMTEDSASLCKSYSFGEVVPTKKDDSEREKDPNVLTQTPSSEQIEFTTQSAKLQFRQSNQSMQFLHHLDDSDDASNRQRYIDEGVMFHLLLSRINTFDDVPSALKQMDSEGYFTDKAYMNEVTRLLEKSLTNTQAREWFLPCWTVINECNIVSRDKDGIVHQQRPDRVITDGKQTIVIDFKTGRQDDGHRNQVKSYMNLLSAMGYPDVKGFVWYLRRGDIVKV